MLIEGGLSVGVVIGGMTATAVAAMSASECRDEARRKQNDSKWNSDRAREHRDKQFKLLDEKSDYARHIRDIEKLIGNNLNKTVCVGKKRTTRALQPYTLECFLS